MQKIWEKGDHNMGARIWRWSKNLIAFIDYFLENAIAFCIGGYDSKSITHSGWNDNSNLIRSFYDCYMSMMHWTNQPNSIFSHKLENLQQISFCSLSLAHDRSFASLVPVYCLIDIEPYGSESSCCSKRLGAAKGRWKILHLQQIGDISKFKDHFGSSCYGKTQ